MSELVNCSLGSKLGGGTVYWWNARRRSEFDWKWEVQNSPVWSWRMWHHCNWGVLKLWWWVILYVLPSNQAGLSLLDFFLYLAVKLNQCGPRFIAAHISLCGHRFPVLTGQPVCMYCSMCDTTRWCRARPIGYILFQYVIGGGIGSGKVLMITKSCSHFLWPLAVWWFNITSPMEQCCLNINIREKKVITLHSPYNCWQRRQILHLLSCLLFLLLHKPLKRMTKNHALGLVLK